MKAGVDFRVVAGRRRASGPAGPLLVLLALGLVFLFVLVAVFAFLVLAVVAALAVVLLTGRTVLSHGQRKPLASATQARTQPGNRGHRSLGDGSK